MMATIEGNELIAIFMEYVFKKDGHYILESNSSGEYYDFWVEDECWWDHGYALDDGLQFDRSWDALMPVVKKIESITIKGFVAPGKPKIVLIPDLTFVWAQCVNFIEWYNTQNHE